MKKTTLLAAFIVLAVMAQSQSRETKFYLTPIRVNKSKPANLDSVNRDTVYWMYSLKTGKVEAWRYKGRPIKTRIFVTAHGKSRQLTKADTAFLYHHSTDAITATLNRFKDGGNIRNCEAADDIFTFLERKK